MLQDCLALPNTGWEGKTACRSRELLFTQAVWGTFLKSCGSENSFKEISPNYIVRFDKIVGPLLFTVCNRPKERPLWKNCMPCKFAVKSVPLFCAFLNEGRRMAWSLSGTTPCRVFTAVFQQRLIHASEQTQTPTSVFPLFTFPKPHLQNKMPVKATFGLIH